MANHIEEVARNIALFCLFPFIKGRNVKGIEIVRERSLLLQQIRHFFDTRGFLEVQTPCLLAHAIVDAYIDPIEVVGDQVEISGKTPSRQYLQTSPELAMKQLLASGVSSIYGIGPAFRAEEKGQLHRTEFTMLEWYQVGAVENDAVRLLGEFACDLLGHSNYEVLDYRQAFLRTLEIDPIDSSLPELVSVASQCDATLASSLATDRDGLLDYLMSEFVQPTLGLDGPMVLRNYPRSQAALAKVSSDDPQCAARFELFVSGVELANGYDELNNVAELAERARMVHEKRERLGRKPIAEMPAELLSQISDGLPQCAGVALGVDRLHLLRSGRKSLDEVSLF